MSARRPKSREVSPTNSFVLDVLEKARKKTALAISKKHAAEEAGIDRSSFGKIIRHGQQLSLVSLEKLAIFVDVPTNEISRHLNIIKWINKIPCEACGQPFTQGARYKRCEECRKDPGTRIRKNPSNPLSSYLATRLSERKQNWAQFSLAIGMGSNYLNSGARQGPSWHPVRSALEGMAQVLEQDVGVLTSIAGGTAEEHQVRRAHRINIIRLAIEADRTKNNSHYETLVRQAIADEDESLLLELADKLRVVERVISPKALSAIRQRQHSLKGKRRPQEFRDRMKRRWQALPEMQRTRQIRQGTAQLVLLTDAQKIARTIRSIAAKKSIDYVLVNMGRYVEWVTTKFKLEPNVAEMQIRNALRLKGYGRRPTYDHLGICERRRASEMWSDIAIDRDQSENVRIAHRQWHRLHNVPSCRG